MKKSKTDRIRIVISDDRKSELIIGILKEFEPKTLFEKESAHIIKTLIFTDGDRVEAAGYLNISHRTLVSKLKVMDFRGYQIPAAPDKIGAFGYIRTENASGAV